MFRSLLIFLLLIANCFAAPTRDPIILCLASEENNYHKQKQTGPLYQLNAALIDLFSSSEAPPFKITIPNDCTKNSFSLTLLEALLIENRSLINYSKNLIQKKHQNDLFDYIFDQSKIAFLKLTADFQAAAPTAECFEQHIPGFAKFIERYKALEDENNYQLIKDDVTSIKNILDSFKHFDDLTKKCLQPTIKKSK